MLSFFHLTAHSFLFKKIFVTNKYFEFKKYFRIYKGEGGTQLNTVHRQCNLSP